jgi:thiosulfate reductase cytochrome b subunit
LLAGVFISLMIPCKTASASKNEACFFCHDKKLPGLSLEEQECLVEKCTAPQSPINVKEECKYCKPVANLSLAINKERYASSVHGDLECISCHEDVKSIPHRQHLKRPTSCSKCHRKDIDVVVGKSVHSEFAKGKFPGCIGCHEPHYGKKKEAWNINFAIEGCLNCHELCTPKLMSKLFSNPTLHLTQIECNVTKISCLLCHVSGKSKDPHKIEPAKSALKNCVACHSSNSILLTEKSVSNKNLIGRITSLDFTNEELMKEGQYVIGANRVPALDTIAIIIIAGTFGLPIVHGGLRFITRKRRKE